MEKDLLKEYKKEIDQKAKEAKIKLNSKKKREYIKFSDYLISKIKAEAVKAAGKDIDIKLPPEGVKADFCFSDFSQKNPTESAKKTAEKLNGKGLIERAEAIGPYVNFSVRKGQFFALTLEEIERLRERYGQSDINKKKTAVIDYSSPNVAKPIGVGHLRSTVIGKALANIYEETGYSCIKDNWLGDWGTQFGKIIYAYLNWGDKEKVSQNPIEELKNLYVEFHQKAKEDPSLEAKARKVFSDLEKGDKDLFLLWKQFRDLSILEFDKIYKMLNADFDLYTGEAYFADQSEGIINDCLKKKACQKKDLLVSAEIPGLPSFLLRKEDGSTLYMTRDLATIRFRIKSFKPQTILYVVGQEQELHLRQLFSLAKKLKYLPLKTEAKHIRFGLVLSQGKKMSTREGNIVRLEDVISEAVLKSKQMMQGEDSDEASRIIGIGAVIWSNLSQSLEKNISFDWDRMLSLESGTSVYLQYVAVRIKSILRKAGQTENPSKPVFKDQAEFDLAKKLSLFPDIIAKAQANDQTHLICLYLEELAQLFNSFYERVQVLKTEDKELKQSRIMLIKAAGQVIERGLGMLNIKTPERM